MRFLGWSGLVWILAVCGAAFGDEVVFKNGDKLSGTIKQVVEGKLVLESEVAGEVTVGMEKVAGSAVPGRWRFILLMRR